MAASISIRNMPDHIWSQLDASGKQSKQKGLSPGYDALQFPKTKVILWDPTPTGSPVYLNVACYRKPRVHLSDKLLRLLHRQCENHPQQCLSTMLLGSLVVDDDGEGITFQMDRLDTRQDIDSSLNLAPEDVTIPFQVYINGSKERNSNVDEYNKLLKSLKSRCKSKESVDLGGFLLIQGWCNFYSGGENCVVHIDFNMVTITTELKAIPILPVPIVPTALSKNLAGPLSFSHIQGYPKTGYLTMDHTRKLLLVLESDPKALSLPIVGIWISGAPVIHHPFVWAACLRYLHNEHIQDRVCCSPDNFLVVLYSPLHSKPEFYECGCRTGNSELDFDLHTGYEASNITKNSRNSGIIPIELNNVKVGPKREVFDAALNVFNRNRNSNKDSNIDSKSNGPDDTVPRLTPAPLVSMAPMIQNLVPDVSFVLNEPSRCRPPTTMGNTQHAPYTRSNSGSNLQSSLPQIPSHNNISLPSNRSNSSPNIFEGSLVRNSRPIVPKGSRNPETQNCRIVRNGQQYQPNVSNVQYHGSSQPCRPSNFQTKQQIPETCQSLPCNPAAYAQQYVNNSVPRGQVPSQTSLPNSPFNHNSAYQQTMPTNYYENSVPSVQTQNQMNYQQIPFKNYGHHHMNPTLEYKPFDPQSQNSAANPSAYPTFQTISRMTPQNVPQQNFHSVPQVSYPQHIPLKSHEQNYVPQVLENSHSQNAPPGDSTCSGKSSDDSGLSVTPDRSNPSPKTGSPENKTQKYSKELTLDSLNKEQCSPEVYNLLMQQDAQLKQLQSQITLLLQNQQMTLTPKSKTTTDCEHSHNNLETRSDTCSVAINTTLFYPDPPDNVPQNRFLNIKKAKEIVPENIPIPSSDSSETSSTGQTPVEIRHKGVLPLNITHREDVESIGDDLCTVINNLGIQDQTTSSSQSESIIECPSFQSSSPRSNYDSKSSTVSPPSASMCITQDSDNSGDYSGTEGNSENPLYYENLIANIRQFLDSHDESGERTDEQETLNNHTSTSSDQLSLHKSQQLHSLLKSAQSGNCVDTTLIPKISYMSMMFDSDSDTSVEINAMAMKYLKDEQLTQMMKLQNRVSGKPSKTGQKKTLLRQLLNSDHTDSPDLSQNGLNDMTFATRKYMEKHGLLNSDIDSIDKTLDFNYQLKTDYSLSSTEMASPVAQTRKSASSRNNNTADAYAKLRLLKSPVKKEIVKKDDINSQEYTPKAYQRFDYGGVQTSSNEQCLQYSPDNYPVFGRTQTRENYGEHRSVEYSSVSEENDNILDIVKLKQLPKLL
ncbi:hypothetical protein LOTGIDRAFT_227950 [Lottia gigantea]|uniref:Uncharacterized protein n=1 Tax=Lottia gigantea TaxID=225164 RepID=V4BCA9_LOTGI|nr:hypothetical protein LOTGIDRAFT_227950 [Lottia gigantea]ESP05316.1 hypothetical protein LOTGIDRAFT_227950 [Lottia gigantea]